MLDKEIYSYLNTLDNLKALLKAKQRGISTDGQKNWCYKDGSNQLHVGADQKYWNGSAWVYASNEFGATTFYGNLALGANTISRDGSANKGFGVSETGIPTVTLTAYPAGDTRTVLRLYDDTAWGIGGGPGISLFGKISDSENYTNFGGIKVSKENEISGDYSASFYIQTRKQGSGPANALRLDSSQNGYIRNKLMVGSLTETPENQLVVYKDADESVFLSVGNSNTGQNGVRIGIDQVLEAGIPVEHVVFDMQYTTRAITFRSEGPVAGVYANLMSLYFGPEQTRIDINGQLNVAGSSSLRNVEAEDVSVNNLEVDDTLTAKSIKADWSSGHLPLYIKNATDAVYAKFETIDDVKTVTIADKLVVDGDLQVDGDIYTTPLTDISSSCYVTGWDTLTTKSIYYRKVGKEVTVYFHLEGTADPEHDTAFIHDIPGRISYIKAYNNCYGKDSTGILANGAIATVEPQSPGWSYIQIMKNYERAPWSTSGEKEVSGSVTFLTD